jgi:hypothetical protein
MELKEALAIIESHIEWFGIGHFVNIDEAWQTLKSAALAQRANNSDMVPCGLYHLSTECPMFNGVCGVTPCMVARRQ